MKKIFGQMLVSAPAYFGIVVIAASNDIRAWSWEYLGLLLCVWYADIVGFLQGMRAPRK